MSPSLVLRTLQSSLETLVLNNVQYVVWKNTHMLASITTATSVELDLYIPQRFLRITRNCLLAQGFIECKQSINDITSIRHFYLVTDDFCLHFHIYFSLCTGDSYTKPFVLPYGKALIHSRVFDEHLKLFVPSLEMEALLTITRIYLKASSVLGLFWIYLEYKDYLSQINSVEIYDHSYEIVGSTALKSFIQSHSTIPLSNPLWLLFLGFRFSLLFRRHRRINFVHEWLLVIKILSKGVFSKLIRKHKKATKGLIVSIVGPDGAGKTTLTKRINTIYSPVIKVKCLHYGRPSPCCETLIFRLALLLHRFFRVAPVPLHKSSSSGTSLLASLRYLILAYERYKTMVRASQLSRSGWLVLTDRSPQMIRLSMDGPRINPEVDNVLTPLQRQLSCIEGSLYSASIKPDLVFRLDLSVSELIERNNDRTKRNKETSEEIVSRHSEFMDSHYPARVRTVNINASQTLSASADEILKYINYHLNH